VNIGEREGGFAALRTCLEIRRRAMRLLKSASEHRVPE
jgi:hypothetical protein